MRITTETEARIEQILSELTLEEKVEMCHANSKFNSGGVERLGIEELSMSDGPHGVRAEVARDSWECLDRESDACTYLPPETTLAATWNPELARLHGEVLGSEARYRGKDIILGPGVNIIRTPLCGRNFEYMSEDPCLTQKLSVELVKGIESQDTAACVKHYCLNNQELDRGHVNVDVSRRALHEIYLKGFHSAIMEGGASSVMGAYNRYQEQHCCHNHYLVNQVLKEDWGFQGVYLTDWGGAHDTEESIYNGLDIEMGTDKPWNEYYLADAFLEKAKESEEVREILDDKVRRILRLMLQINKFSPDRKPGEFNTKEHQQATYDIAAEGMVLLKNDAVLPMDKKQLKKVLVVGPNADKKHAEGGSSSGIKALYEITPLQGIKDRLGDTCEIEYLSGESDVKPRTIPLQNLGIIELTAGTRSYKTTTYWKQEDGSVSEEVAYRDTPNGPPHEAAAYDVEFKFEVPEDGHHVLKFYIHGDLEVDITGAEPVSVVDDYQSWDKYYTYHYELKKGQVLHVKAHAVHSFTNFHFEIGWIAPSDYGHSASEKELMKKAADADCVIYCGGLNHGFDTEGLDKKNMRLPSEQNEMIPKLAAANPNMIVALTAGSPVEMPWIDEVKAVIWNWYGGMEGGHVLCDILTGEICPSGKMPFTLPKKFEDHPAARYGEYQSENCKYKEDILVGYRGFDYDNIEPLFPFGHGLSYSSFAYSDLQIEKNTDEVSVSFRVTNTGSVKAKETAQLYIGDETASVVRPPKELRGFSKVELAPGESKVITLPVTERDLAFYDEASEDWKVEEGTFLVYVGSSSRDIRLEGSFEMC